MTSGPAIPEARYAASDRLSVAGQGFGNGAQAG